MHEATYGDFEFIPDSLVPEAQLDFSVSPIDLTAHWNRCGLISDMTAGYIAHAYSDGADRYKSPVFSSISTICQELIENAARYSRQREALISVCVKHYNRVVQIQVRNESMPRFADAFEEHLKLLMDAQDLELLYVQVMEEQVRTGRQSGIGLLILMKDYPIRLAVRFNRDKGERAQIVVRAYYHMEISDDDPLSSELLL